METVDILTIVLAMLALIVSVVTYGKTVIHDRKRDTLDAYNQLQEQALDYLNYYMPAAVVEIAKNPRSEEYKKISAYIARIEHFCVGVNQKIYDRKTVYELAEGYLDKGIRSRIEPIIDRKNRGDRDFYENIHKVYKWMEEEETKRRK